MRTCGNESLPLVPPPAPTPTGPAPGDGVRPQSATLTSSPHLAIESIAQSFREAFSVSCCPFWPQKHRPPTFELTQVDSLVVHSQLRSHALPQATSPPWPRCCGQGAAGLPHLCSCRTTHRGGSPRADVAVTLPEPEIGRCRQLFSICKAQDACPPATLLGEDELQGYIC